MGGAEFPKALIATTSYQCDPFLRSNCTDLFQSLLSNDFARFLNGSNPGLIHVPELPWLKPIAIYDFCKFRKEFLNSSSSS